jgi:heptosyltransferase-3
MELPSRPRILVVALRRIGDVLLTTPLLRSLRRAWPEARIEALVFADTAEILAGNSDLDAIIAMPQRPSAVENFSLARRLLKRYDLAISTQAGDRPFVFTVLAGRKRVGFVDARLNGRMKGLVLDRSVQTAGNLHRVSEILLMAEVLGIERVAELVCPRFVATSGLVPAAPYAVIHAAPMYRYKRWTRDGWRELASALGKRGLTVVTTGGAGDAERRYLDDIWTGIIPAEMRLDGKIPWGGLAELLSEAAVYVGPDTSVSHLAAASGCPTVALYGPTDPRLWGPWPVGSIQQPWKATGAIQNCGNVWLIQNPLPCTPCQEEGCERHVESFSQCLEELALAQVLVAVDQALASRPEPAVLEPPQSGAPAQRPI